MKREKKINESKELIKNALFRVMIHKDFAEITMSEVAEEAQVARMTLYRHFKEKEQILIFCFEEYLKQAIEEMGRIDSPTMNDLLSFRFRVLKESPYTLLMAKNNQLDQIFTKFGKNNGEYFSDLLPKIEDVYIQAFIAGGIDSITKKWIEDGMVESYDVMANKVNAIVYRLVS